MNREIKFRGKRVDNGEWIYGVPFFVKSEGAAFIINNCQTLYFSDKDSSFDGFRVIPETVGEFTGAKDKNAKEIYEGDILHYQGIISGGKKIIRNISFSDRRSQFMFGHHSLYDFSLAPRVIVGNIHENPELLQ